MYVKRPLLNLLLCIAMFSALLSIWVTQREMWDGVYVEYAFKTLDMSGLLHGANASGWPIAGWIYKLQLTLQEFFHFPYWLFVDIAYTAAMMGIAYEVFSLARWQLKLSQSICIQVVILFLAQPIWHLLMSGVHLIHIVGFWFLLLGHRLSYSQSMWRVLAGLVFLTLSFQFPASFFMVFWLEWIYFVNTKKTGSKACGRAFAVIGYTFFWYALSRTVFKPVEIYSGYNQVQFPASLDALKSIIWTWMKFASWIIGLTSPLWIKALLKHGFQLQRLTRQLKVMWKDGTYKVSPISIALLGCLIAAVPYIVVGKGPVLIFPFEWTSRHALPLALPLSILVALTIPQLCADSDLHDAQRQERKLVTTMVFVWLSRGVFGLAGKLYQIRLEKAIEASLRNFPAPASGLVTLRLPFNPVIRIGPPEVNGIFWRAYGRTEWAVMIGPPDNWVNKIRQMYVGESPNSLKNIKNPDLWKRFAVIGDLKSFDCETSLRLNLPNGELGVAAWASWLGWSPFQFSVTLEKTSCP